MSDEAFYISDEASGQAGFRSGLLHQVRVRWARGGLLQGDVKADLLLMVQRKRFVIALHNSGARLSANVGGDGAVMRSLGYWMGRRIPPAAARAMTTAVIALALAGCATGELSDLELAPEQATYRLGAGDKLKITVYGEERLTGEYSVSGEGIVAFPLVGEVAAVGKTLTEFEGLLAAELGDGLINDPNVTVEVANYRPYYILGEVARPGEYPFADSLTVFSAVARAGGFTYRASQGRVYIRHKDGAEEVAYRLKGSMPVQPGDTIRVPERHF